MKFSTTILTTALLFGASLGLASTAQAQLGYGAKGPQSYGGAKQTHKPASPFIRRASRYLKGHGKAPYCAPKRVWVPGSYQAQQHKVWVPGYNEQVWCAPVFETRYDHCGRAYSVQVSAGYYRTVQHPGHYQIKSKRVWCPGHWSTKG